MGAVGILQVKNEYKAKEFGVLMVKAFSKQSALQYDVDITAHIIVSNVASTNLFTKLGFVKTQRNLWIGLKA